MEVFRTPDERFEGLTGFPYPPAYEHVGELRMARVEVGDGAPVVMIHGEPTWSYIWRKVIPPLADAGHRCIALDHAGFGRSDKPVDPAWHSLEHHVAITGALFERLDLRDATIVVHDWGGPIGLNVALFHPDRVARIVILDTAIDPREPWMSATWVRFREFVEETEDFPVGEGMRGACFQTLEDDVVAAYDAPFPTPESKAAVRGMPMLVPRIDDDPDATRGVEDFHDVLRRDPRPVLMLWGEHDLFLTLASGERMASRIGRRIDHVIPNAGHGLQEDQGPMVGSLIADWLAR